MYRSLIEKLLNWKDSPRRKPLILTGVRQCGKTHTIEDFGVAYFENFVYINFEVAATFSAIFEYDFNIPRIVRELETATGFKITAGNTLLFFDEIQECPRAITSLKYFCENFRELHVICAGSLLGVALKKKDISFPVGKVNRMSMYPMSFKEFVIACGDEKHIEALKDWPLDRPIPELHSVPLLKDLKDYYIVGGMPEAVAEWTTNHRYETVEEIQDEIIADYADDFSKHAPDVEVPKIRMIWDSVPVQLAKENNKFMFSHVKEGKRAAELENALDWLKDAGLAYALYLVENAEIPLSSQADLTYFKIYMADVGLLRRKAGVPYKTILDGSDLFKEYKGAIAENFVMAELVKMGIEPYFWRSGNTAELDFMFEKDAKVVPIEVKSAENTQAKSFKLFCKKYAPAQGFKLSLKNLAENPCEATNAISLPLFAIWKLLDYVA